MLAIVRTLLGLLAITGCGRVGFDAGAPDDASALDAVAPASACATATGLVACFDFEGTGLDFTANGNHATTTSVTYVPAVHGLGVRVDDASEIVTPASASLDLTSAMTFEAWIYLEA